MTRPVNEVQRILALVPFLVAHPGIAKTEVAERFGLSAAQLDADLGLVLMIGTPPFSPGDYIDVDDDGESVTLWMAESFRRPVRLSPSEGLALLAAGRVLLAVPGSDPDGPLASALAKLEAALGAPGLVVQMTAPARLDAVREAVDARRRIEIDYWSAGRDELTTRLVDPLAVFSATGEWYLEAYCHRAAADRLFRIDRIRELRPTEEHFTPPDDDPGPPVVFHPRPDDPRVTVDLAPSASWVVERYPTESVFQRDDGRLRVSLAVSEPTFLARLLLALGADATVVEPAELRSVAGEAAARVLARYRASARTVGNRNPSDSVGSVDE